MGESANTDLQFESAEYVEPAKPEGGEYEEGPFYCVVCKSELTGTYYEIPGGKDLCEPCKIVLTTPPGTPALRFWRAFGVGSGAAVLGFLVYYAVLRATGYQIGLISIAVGYGVGYAVRKGARNVGGIGYQMLAVTLTYVSITMTYFVAILDYAASHGTHLGAFGYVIAFGLSLVGPFLELPSGLLGLLILGFGVWEAWKINRRPKWNIEGPFVIEPPATNA